MSGGTLWELGFMEGVTTPDEEGMGASGRVTSVVEVELRSIVIELVGL